jgi:glycosyltransferase involved in cell wall biosynthesis
MRRVALAVGTTAGGTGTHVRILAEALAGVGIGVLVCGPAAAGADFRFGALAGVRFEAVEFGDRPRLSDVSAVFRLRRLLRGMRLPRPDVVHAHGLRAGALAALALAATRSPRLVVTVHNAPPAAGAAARRVYFLLERIVARKAALVLCVSSDLERRMRDAGARRVERAVIAAPVPPRPAPARPSASAPARLSASAPGQRPVVLAVGRLAPQKGFATLLDAAARWRDVTPRPRVVIVGEGPLDRELRGRAGELGLDAEFLGSRTDIPALLAVADVFVLPSVWEGQPLVLQEALRAGVPVVASRAGGIPDLTGDDAALLVPPGDPEQLADAVRRVLTDAALSDTLRAAAASRAGSLPTTDDAVAAATAAYGKALS